jgi:probable rRNA maturation factor
MSRIRLGVRDENQGSRSEYPLVRHRAIEGCSVWRRAHLDGSRQMKISIASPQELVPIDRSLMRQTARTVLEGEGVKEAEISLAFVDDSTIHQLNNRYLQHNEPTDVLSFPLSEPTARRLAGELVIGAEVAKAQAECRGHEVQAELMLYVIHGLLHLCGYDDKTATKAIEMRQRERHYLQALGLPDIAPE